MNEQNLPVLNDAKGLYHELEKINVIDQYEPEHIFTEGLYTRVLTIPAHHFCIGKVHRFKTLNILLQGEIIIYVAENQPPKIFKAPAIFESLEQTRKIGYALSEVKFANVHITNETDLEIIENNFVIPESELLDSDIDNFRLQIGGSENGMG